MKDMQCQCASDASRQDPLVAQLQGHFAQADSTFAADMASREQRFRQLEGAVTAMAATQATSEAEVTRLHSSLAARSAPYAIVNEDSEAKGSAYAHAPAARLGQTDMDNSCSGLSSSSDNDDSNHISIQEAVADAIAQEGAKRRQQEE